MKKHLSTARILFGTALAIALFYPSLNALAAASFNNDSQDRPTLQVSNYSLNPGCTTCWSTSVSANAGDIVSFLIYYHNTSQETALQTRLNAILPSAAFTSVVVTGQVWAQNASPAMGNASIHLSSSQTLTFIPGSVSWYPNRSSSAQSLLNGQSGSEVVSSGGLNVGDVAPGWGTQGYLVFRAQVSNNTSGSAPSVITNSATNISQNSATLNGSVNPNNSNTNVWFEYGTTFSLGNQTNTQSAGNGSNSISLNFSLSNLQPNTTYYFRAVAQNSFGTSQGSILSFTTNSGGGGGSGSAPTVYTNSATGVGQNFATFNATVNPNESNTNMWFEYGTNFSLGYTTGYQSVGNLNYQTNIMAYAGNLNPNATYYFRAVAQNSFGTSYGSILSFNTSGYGYGGYYGNYNNNITPTVYTNSASNIYGNSVTLNGSVNPNGSYANAWFEYGTTYSLGYTTGYQSVGTSNYQMNIAASLSNLSPNATIYFRAVAQNTYGTSYGSILSFTTGAGGYTGYGGYSAGNAPSVYTSPATFIFRNSAMLNGSVNPNSSLATAWFEWGTNSQLGNRTSDIGAGQGNYSSPVSFALTGLSDSTDYYFRLVAQNSYGTNYGTVYTFKTQNGAYTAPRVYQQPTVYYAPAAPAAKEAPIVLSPSVDNPNPQAGDEISLIITYRNNGKNPVSNAVLRVVLPKEVSYISSNVQPSSVDGNNLRYELGTFYGNSQGVITVKVKIDSSVDAGSALVFGSILDYNDERGKFQSVNAYLTVAIKGAKLTASILDFLYGFLNNWFVDLLLGLALGFGIYHFFIKGKDADAAA